MLGFGCPPKILKWLYGKDYNHCKLDKLLFCQCKYNRTCLECHSCRIFMTFAAEDHVVSSLFLLHIHVSPHVAKKAVRDFIKHM